MSNVLFLTSVYDFNDKGNLNTDLVDTIASHGNTVTVMTPKERKYNPSQKITSYGSVKCLEFKCLNFRGKVNIIEKGLATLSLGIQYKHSFKKYFDNEKYDVVIYTTLPITYAPIVNYLKGKGAVSYLLQKDFFPQSAVDLDILRKDSLSYKLFRRIEKGLFKCSDAIGVISPKNIEFFRKNNPDLNSIKVEYCPNSIVPMPDERFKNLRKKKEDRRCELGIPKDAIVFIYGGLISRAQGAGYIKAVFTELSKNNIDAAFFIIIGNGNNYEDLKEHIQKTGLNNVMIKPFMPKKQFDQYLYASDVGFVFLDNRFTIANIPSRTLAHLDMGQPILAATDAYTDYKELIENHKIGLWCESTDPKPMVENIRRMVEDCEFRAMCADNSRRLMKEKFTTEITYDIIKNSTGRLE